MRLATAVKTLEKQAAWLGITNQDLLVDIQKHGRMLYPETVVEAYAVYDLSQRVKNDLLQD